MSGRKSGRGRSFGQRLVLPWQGRIWLVAIHMDRRTIGIRILCPLMGCTRNGQQGQGDHQEGLKRSHKYRFGFCSPD